VHIVGFGSHFPGAFGLHTGAVLKYSVALQVGAFSGVAVLGSAEIAVIGRRQTEIAMARAKVAVNKFILNLLFRILVVGVCG